jgi:two-component system, NtrC family, response regulator HydG
MLSAMSAEKDKIQILLIDDNLSFLKSMRLALGKIGFQCQIAQSIEAAKDLLSGETFNMIICDYFMPDCDGKSALAELGEAHKKCRLILTSSYPLDIEFKKSDRFIFVDKLGLLEWLSEKYTELQYV